MRARTVTTLLAAGILATIAAPAAHAAFPGKNGLIAFQKSKGPNEEIYVIGPNGGKERDVTNTRKFGESSPSFSPNGRTIAFLWFGPGSPTEQKGGIGIINSDGSGMKHLTAGNIVKAPIFSPTWSADGKAIYYVRDIPVPGQQYIPGTIWSISAGGGTQHQVTTGSDGDVLASPLGGELAFIHTEVSEDSTTQFVITDLAGANPRTVIADHPSLISDWSPDAKRFVYQGRGRAVWTLPVDGGPPTEIANGPKQDEDPAFSPDGRFVVWSNEGTHDLWIGNSNGGGAHVLAHHPGFAKDPTWGRAPKRH